ncbi:hypothetical protein CMV_013934 [Castanea mollissima]|uniref:Uncharacterized protein n=1 Tax=Castanea mollissima TaxID=60419 RepID=A0A8J4RC64_9ROSI|nr:hypothetical protein CMV_013934 [Castanea mollissima]
MIQNGYELQLEWERDKLFDLDVATMFQKLIMEDGILEVTEISEKQESKSRPAGLNTVNLLKVLYPSHYAVGGTGPPTLIPQVHRHYLETAHPRTFAEVVQGFHGRVKDRVKPKQVGSMAKGKKMHLGGEMMEGNRSFIGAKVGVSPVGKSDTMMVGGDVRREKCIHEKSVAESRIQFPSSSLNSKAYDSREVRRPCWAGRGLIIEVDVMGRRRVSWDKKKGREQKQRWVSRAGKEVLQGKLGLGLGPNRREAQRTVSEKCLGPQPINPSSLEPGECSDSWIEPSPPAETLEKTEKCLGVRPTGLVTPSQVAGGREWFPKVRAQTGKEDLCLSVYLEPPTNPVPPPPATRRTGELVGSPHRRRAPPVGVAEWAESPPATVFRLSWGRNVFLGSISHPWGLLSDGKRSVAFNCVPRSLGPFIPDLFLELVRAGSRGSGVVGQEVNPFFSKEICLHGEVSLVEEAAVGEVACPLQIFDPNGSITLAELELEEVDEVLSIESNLDISGWVKHRIPDFSKLVGLSMTRHEKLCIDLLQRLELEMEAANVLHRKVMGSNKVAKSKTKGCRELQNLFSSVNYDRR